MASKHLEQTGAGLYPPALDRRPAITAPRTRVWRNDSNSLLTFKTSPRGPLARTARAAVPAGPQGAQHTHRACPARRSPRCPGRSSSPAAQTRPRARRPAHGRPDRPPAFHRRPRLRRGDVSSHRQAHRASVNPVPRPLDTCGPGASCAPGSENPGHGWWRRACPGVRGLQ